MEGTPEVGTHALEQRLQGVEGRLTELEDAPSDGGGGLPVGDPDAAISAEVEKATQFYFGADQINIDRDTNLPVVASAFQLLDPNGDPLRDEEPGLTLLIDPSGNGLYWMTVRRATVQGVFYDDALDLNSFYSNPPPGSIENLDDLAGLFVQREGVQEFVAPPSVDEQDWGNGPETTILYETANGHQARRLEAILAVIHPGAVELA